MINITCAWCLIANATLLNIEWPDLNSQYYATFINNSKSLSISGYFPNSRYFSFELYDLIANVIGVVMVIFINKLIKL